MEPVDPKDSDITANGKIPEVEIQHHDPSPGKDQEDTDMIDAGDPQVPKKENFDVQFVGSNVSQPTIYLLSDDEGEVVPPAQRLSVAKDDVPVNDSTASAIPTEQAVANKEDATMIDAADPPSIKNENNEVRFVRSNFTDSSIIWISDDEDEDVPPVQEPSVAKDDIILNDTPEITIPTEQTVKNEDGATMIDAGDPPVPKKENFDVQFVGSNVSRTTIDLLSDDEDDAPVQRPTVAKDDVPLEEVTPAEIPEVAAAESPDAIAAASPDATAAATPGATATAIPDATATAIPDATAAAIPDVTVATIPDAQKVKTKKPLWPILGSVSAPSATHRSRLELIQKRLSEKATGQSAPTKAKSLYRPGSTKGNKVQVDMDKEDGASTGDGAVANDGAVADDGAMANDGAVVDDQAVSEDTLGFSSDTDDGGKFQALEKEYDKKTKKGDVSIQEQIAFLKAKKEEDIRLKRRKLEEQFAEAEAEAEAEDNGDNLFFPMPAWSSSNKRTHAAIDPPSDGMEDEEADVQRQIGLNERAKINKIKRQRLGPLIQPTRNAMSAKESNASMLPGLEAGMEKDRKRAAAKHRLEKAKAKSTSNRSSGKSRGNKATTAESSTKKKKKSSKKPKGPEMTNLNSLFGRNVIADAQCNARLGEQETSNATRKDQALMDLIASIPSESRRMASVDKKALDKASKCFAGHGSMKADGDKGWKLKGMKSSLYHYQLLGAAFMRNREGGVDQPLGGICADEMGFGKTVMMIANILDGRPAPKDDIKTTLIVATPPLVTQWMREIELHCEPGMMGEVIRYHAGARLVSNNTVESLKRSNIILTTYTEVLKSYPKCEYPEELTTRESKQAWWLEHFEKHKGPLHRIMFHRVVLDEAQAIKNHQSRTSIACRGLAARHRWAISATPIQNGIFEFWSILAFLRVKNTGSFETFSKNFSPKGRPELGIQRMHEFLRPIMMRRTHLEQIFGKPILKLPPSDQQITPVRFNDLERAIYQIVRARFIQRINMYSARGILDKKYRHIFTMVLRLRQLTGHIFMIQETIEDLLEQEDIEKLMRLASTEVKDDTPNQRSILQLRAVLASRKSAENNSDPPNVSSDTPSAPSDEPNASSDTVDCNIGGEFGSTNVSFKKYLRNIRENPKWAELEARSLCPQCRQPPDTPWVTSCNHIYCGECLHTLQYEASKKKQDRASCKECGVVFTSSEPASGLDELGFEGSSPASETRRKKKKDSQTENVPKWIDVKGHILPSAKTLAIKAQVLNWLEDAPKEKIIIFTQFHEMQVYS